MERDNCTTNKTQKAVTNVFLLHRDGGISLDASSRQQPKLVNSHTGLLIAFH